jgi:hypothetical protein
MSLHIKFFSPCVFIIFVYIQFSGDLFILETHENILKTLKEVSWKRLTLVCAVTLTLIIFLEFRVIIPFDIFVPTQMTVRRGKLLCFNASWSNQKTIHKVCFLSFLQANIVSSSYGAILTSSSLKNGTDSYHTKMVFCFRCSKISLLQQ